MTFQLSTVFLLTRYAICLKVTLAMENGHHGENALLLVAWVVGHDFEHVLAAVQDQMLIGDRVKSKTALVCIFVSFHFNSLMRFALPLTHVR